MLRKRTFMPPHSIPANAGICTHRFAMQITAALRRRQIPAFAGMEGSFPAFAGMEGSFLAEPARFFADSGGIMLYFRILLKRSSQMKKSINKIILFVAVLLAGSPFAAGSYLYLVDPEKSERLKKAIATPGKVYDMYDERRGSEKRVGQWRFDPETGEEERIYDGEQPRTSFFGGAWRGIKQGTKTMVDSVTHGIPAMVGDREDVDAFHALQERRKREYETETPLHEQSVDARPFFGDDGYLSLDRIGKLIGYAIPSGAILLLILRFFWN